MALPTRLTETLGVEHPVMLAGMGGVSYHRLTAAVSAAGGFGCLGASVMSHEQMVTEISQVRAATDRPFGVDLLTAMPGDMVGQVELLIAGGASLFVAGLGVPAAVVDLCHRHGVLVANMCGKVAHARKAVDAGCDLVIAQGTEGGGHTGQVATMPLVPLIVDAVGDSGAGRGRRRHLRRTRPRRCARTRRRRRVARHPFHRHARSARRAGLQGGARRRGGGRRRSSAGRTRARRCGCCATDTPTTGMAVPARSSGSRCRRSSRCRTVPSTSVAMSSTARRRPRHRVLPGRPGGRRHRRGHTGGRHRASSRGRS